MSEYKTTLHVTSTITVRVSAMFVCKVVPLTIWLPMYIGLLEDW